MHRLNLNSHIDLLNHFNSDIVDLRDCVHPNYIGPGKRTFQIGDGIIDQNPNPLATYIFSRDKTLIGEFLRKTQAGTASVIDTVMQILPPYLPYGGVGSSGMGKYHGEKSFETFSNMRAVLVKSNLFDIPLRYPPYSQLKTKVINWLLG